MDYGHTNPQGNMPPSPEQDFFTSGVGNTPASENAPDKIDDLNTDQDPWTYAPEHDNAAIGNKAISSSDILASANTQRPKAELGKIVNVGRPTSAVSAPENTATIVDLSAIRAEGNHIGKNTLVEVGKVEKKLDRDHDLCSFYSDYEKMKRSYLKNSYNRDIGEAA